MIIYYLHHYATPPSVGVVGRPHSLAKGLSQLGHRLIIVCASDHHLRAAPALVDSGDITVEDGVEYLVLPVRPYKGNGLRRLQNVFDYCRGVSTLGESMRRLTIPQADIIIASSAPLFVESAAERLSLQIRVPYILEVRDIWPLSLVEIAGVSRWHPIVLWMSMIERKAYRQAAAVVSLLPNALEHMQAKGLKRERFFYVPNGISIQSWSDVSTPLPEQHTAVFERIRSLNKAIIVYCGSHGPPNALEQIIDLKKVIGDVDPPYHFIMIGDGISKNDLIARAEAEQCSFIDFLPRVSKAQSLAAIQKADFCYISWHDKAIYRYGISPNKISEYMYAQRPVIHVVPETNDPVKEANAGISTKPYDPYALDAAIRTLCSMSFEQRATLGRNGREYVLKHLEWSMLARKYVEIMERFKAV